MKKLFAAIILAILTSCTFENITVPNDAIIVNMYIMHDEDESPNLINCAQSTEDFLIYDEYNCSFKVDDFEFDIEDKYVFNEEGEFIEFWNFLSEGPLISKIEELNQDKKYLTFIDDENLTAKWGIDKKTVIVGEHTLKIERIFPKYKLIWIEKEGEIKKNGRRILIEYK